MVVNVDYAQRHALEEIQRARELYEENTYLREQLADCEERLEAKTREVESCQRQNIEYMLREERRKAFLRNKDLIPMEKLVALETLEYVESKREDIHASTDIKVRDIAANLGTTPETAGKRLRALDRMGLLSYTDRTEWDQGEFNTIASVAFTNLVKSPESIQKAVGDKQGGPREKKCKNPHCDSTNFDSYTALYCRDCNHVSIYGQVGLSHDANVQSLIAAMGDENNVHVDVSAKCALPEGVKPEPFPIYHDAFEEKALPFPIYHDAFEEIEELAPPVEASENVLSWENTIELSRQDVLAVVPEESPLLPQEEISTDNVNTMQVCTDVVEPPTFLRVLPIWCCHRAKVPYTPRGRTPQKAKSNDASTWGPYEQARSMYESSVKEGWKYPFDGIELMCDGTFTVIDFDHCIVDGQIDATVWARAGQIASYMEVSPSGTGIHCIALGTIPAACKRPDIEMYCERRPLTWTGNHILGTPETIEDQQAQILALYKEVPPEKVVPEVVMIPRPGTPKLVCPDETIIYKACTAKNGEKFLRLWEGDITGYGSASEADQALCNMLAYWTDGSVDTITRLFRISKLYRQKWERDDYRDRTIGEALRLWAQSQQRSAS